MNFVILVLQSGRVTMLAVRLPEEIETRLESLAETTGRTKSFYVREAILTYLDELEDAYLAAARLEDLKKGKGRLYTLEEVEKKLGLGD
jgi:RHH-type rel operon transcriptional repressor/antitoxin RelB